MSTQTANSTELHLQGRWARAVWLIIAMGLLGFYGFTAWVYYRALLTNPFFGSTVAPSINDLEVAQNSLAKLGLSLNIYAAIFVGRQTLFTFVVCTLGALIFWRRAPDRLAWTMSLILILMGTLVPNQTYALGRIYPALSFLGFVTNQIAATARFVLFWIFPDGRFVPAWSRWTFLSTIVFGVLATLPIIVGSALPIGILLALAASAVIGQIYRYQKVSGPLERQQTKWVLLALISAPITWAVGGLLIPAIFPALTQNNANTAPYNLIRTTFTDLSNLLIPLAIGLAILRYRLFDIDLIIRRTLQYSLLSGLLALVYFGGIVILQSLFSTISNQQSPIILVLSTLAIAALFLPLRRRVQDFIDKRFYRRKYDAAKVIADFAATARDETDLDALTARLVEVVDETMQPESVGLWLKPTQTRPDKFPNPVRSESASQVGEQV